MKRQKQHTTSAFTLIELLIYVALISIFISGAIIFAWDVIGIGAKNRNSRFLTDHARFIHKKLQNYGHNAIDFSLIDASSICLNFDESALQNPVKIYLSGQELKIAWGGPSDCSAPSEEESLTDSDLLVTELIFSNLSSDDAKSKNFHYQFKVKSSGQTSEYHEELDLNSSVELRSN